ncbi:hypothetical protein LCGC14_0808470 [marine sediment metagenome]|uniref:Uncharacterized protein n=1 Tax=marine sediment metagenome TaxID=412755 RepID=A0A0F9PMG0_9ZZZZ
MNVRLIREIAQTIVILVVCVGIVMLIIGGCASFPSLSHDQCNATLYETAMEHEQCLLAATKHEERLERRAEQRDKLIMFLNACDAANGLILLEVIKYGSSNLPRSNEKRIAMREYGYKYTHDNVGKDARINDFRCIRDLRRIF